MKISTLIKREPFSDIFEKTMESFLGDLTNCTCTVQWRVGTNFKQDLAVGQKWYCNPLINSVFVKGVNSKVFRSINGEYKHNPLRPWLSIAQKLYLMLSQAKLTAVFFTKYTITISPQVLEAKDKLIIGGNTKLRMIDISNNKVYVILKEGFDSKYLEQELYPRTNFLYIPIPKVIEHSDNTARWYSEEYIVGLPTSRINKDIGNQILTKAVECIHKMLNETKEQVILGEYTTCLKNKINQKIDNTSYIKESVKNNIKQITCSLVESLDQYSDNLMTMAYCHGDFHQGNILTNGEKFWILDWEFSGKRQIFYDLIILLLGTRVDNDFSSRFIKLLNSEYDVYSRELINNWPENQWYNDIQKKIDLTVFLLEDIMFYIDENDNDIFYQNRDVMTLRCKELKIITNHLMGRA
jgi:thiamine kinase-like enzyme